MSDLDEIAAFLPCVTPDAWIEAALQNQNILLIDHANCEKKAASTALNLMFRYIEQYQLLHKMSRLAREELRHFEQVIALMEKRSIAYVSLPAANYAGELRKLVSTWEPMRLIDILVAGALIEARSCERFAKLAPHLDAELSDFYRSLLKSEARHFTDYLTLARQVAAAHSEPVDVDARIAVFSERERQLIEEPCAEFRFHSGPPIK
ncbi:MAG: tRNA-(ms[2]io[6]A)-hydroxylase [Gammaproteobacteria bacterium]|nr:tRNA-(ms[2]io[6]A)-hydroxylase [Gammaproteobacteria bacterium]MBQ0840975.1 tRNA-(ms[2]io[6]A)-hydroxylase [Gammaproteobacteria bacterium]